MFNQERHRVLFIPKDSAGRELIIACLLFETYKVDYNTEMIKGNKWKKRKKTLTHKQRLGRK